MSKSKKRKKLDRAKVDRKSKILESGGKSKYAQKHARNVRGNFSPTSPFYAPSAAPQREGSS